MNAGKIIDWEKLSVKERNRLCGDVLGAKPIPLFWVCFNGARSHTIRVSTLAEARKLVAMIKASKEKWQRVWAEFPWAWRHRCSVEEDGYHMNYTGTPGGAWMLVEALRKAGWSVRVGVDGKQCTASAYRSNGAESHYVVTVGSMAETVAVLFLIANGMEVDYLELMRGEGEA